jgi:SAM-dependent methyltransferase
LSDDDDDEELPLEPSAEVVALFAAGVIRPTDRVLDLGCFQGDDVVYLRTGGCDAIGIDASKTAISYADALAKNFNRHRLGRGLRRSLLERCRQHHDRAEVDLAPEKAHRRRRAPATAALHGTAEAVPHEVLLAPLVSAARTARIVRHVEPPAAERTPR